MKSNNLKNHLRLEKEQQTKFKRITKNEIINISVKVNEIKNKYIIDQPSKKLFIGKNKKLL